jgi:LytS/YehU family sensor histidine kinase
MLTISNGSPKQEKDVKSLCFCSLSDNAGLCGVPSLPRCSALWEEAHRLSSGAKVGIAFAVVATIAIGLLAAYVFVQRKNREDYNFGLPHQLASKSKS